MQWAVCESSAYNVRSSIELAERCSNSECVASVAPGVYSISRVGSAELVERCSERCFVVPKSV